MFLIAPYQNDTSQEIYSWLQKLVVTGNTMAKSPNKYLASTIARAQLLWLRVEGKVCHSTTSYEQSEMYTMPGQKLRWVLRRASSRRRQRRDALFFAPENGTQIRRADVV